MIVDGNKVLLDWKQCRSKWLKYQIPESLILNFHMFWGALFAIYRRLNIAFKKCGLKYCNTALSTYHLSCDLDDPSKWKDRINISQLMGGSLPYQPDITCIQ